MEGCEGFFVLGRTRRVFGGGGVVVDVDFGCLGVTLERAAGAILIAQNKDVSFLVFVSKFN